MANFPDADSQIARVREHVERIDRQHQETKARVRGALRTIGEMEKSITQMDSRIIQLIEVVNALRDTRANDRFEFLEFRNETREKLKEEE